MSEPTVLEVWKLAMPLSTQLAAGEKGLGRIVQWAVTPSTRYPAFATLQGGELALFPLAHLSYIDEHLTPRRLVERMEQAGIVAIAFDGALDQKTIAFSDRQSIPLFILPPLTHLRHVEQAIIRLIVNRQAQLVQQGQLIYTQLMQLSMTNRGLSAIVQSLCELTGHAAVLYNRKGVRHAEACPPTFTADLSQYPSQTTIPQERSRDQAIDSTACSLNQHGLAGCASAVRVNHQLWGYLHIIGSHAELDDLDRLAAEQGALICAVEINKTQSVASAENRLRGSLIDMLLSTSLVDAVELKHRAELTGYNLDGCQIAFSWGVAGRDQDVHAGVRQIERALGELNEQQGKTLIWQRREKQVIALAASPQSIRTDSETFRQPTLTQSKAMVEAIRQRIANDHAGLTLVTAGIGNPQIGMNGARTSLRQALEALHIGQEVMRVGGTFLFCELGVYRLLSNLRHTEDLMVFYQETLAPLAQRDAKNNSELVKTLSVFLAHNGNVSRTAQALHLHRSSLIYRLGRISKICHLNLDDPEARFQLYLALKIQPFVEIQK